MVSSRTADRPHGPCRVLAPLSSTETDEGKGRGGGARGARRVTTTEASSSPAGSSSVLKKSPAGACQHLCQVSELVIEVPKISLDVIPLRTLVPEPQLVEQLVEVPTTVSYSSLQRTLEQHRHSSSWWWRLRFWSSRFFLWTETNSDACLKETHF